jgi:hypothetical protein
MSDSSRNPPWLEDEPSTSCGGCNSQFTMILRRVIIWFLIIFNSTIVEIVQNNFVLPVLQKK